MINLGNQLQSVARRLPPSNSPGLSKYLTKTSWDNLGSLNPIGPFRGLEALAKTCSFFRASAGEIPRSRVTELSSSTRKIGRFFTQARQRRTPNNTDTTHT